MPRHTVILDACVLVPIALADTLLRVAERGLYRPLWSELILDEARAAVEKIHPDMDRTQLSRRFAEMRDVFDDALVTDWEKLESSVTLPDPDDRHVVAAAIRSGAQVIVTFNLSDFPEKMLRPFDLEPVHPDDFLLDQLDLSPSAMTAILREQSDQARRPPLTTQDLAVRLGRAGVPQFAEEILRLLPAIRSTRDSAGRRGTGWPATP
jgi:predicted nucleic acid-binding protein